MMNGAANAGVCVKLVVLVPDETKFTLVRIVP